jgi:GDP-mannose 6-dehydrogenase
MRDSVKDVLDHAEVLVIGNKAAEFKEIETQLRADQTVIDLVRLFDGKTSDKEGAYQGICW